jgi:hypothetical protein
MKIAGNGMQKYNYILMKAMEGGIDNCEFKKIPDDIGGDNP